MTNYLRQLLRDESGAVTVDFVVLTAAILGMAMLVLQPIAYSADNSSQRVSDYVLDVPVGFGNGN